MLVRREVSQNPSEWQQALPNAPLCAGARRVETGCSPSAAAVRRAALSTTGRSRAAIPGKPAYLSGENEVGAKSELSILATIGPEASLAVRTRTHSGSVTNFPHFASLSAMLSQTSM
jgi:hypothetical protein